MCAPLSPLISVPWAFELRALGAAIRDVRAYGTPRPVEGILCSPLISRASGFFRDSDLPMLAKGCCSATLRLVDRPFSDLCVSRSASVGSFGGEPTMSEEEVPLPVGFVYTRTPWEEVGALLLLN